MRRSASLGADRRAEAERSAILEAARRAPPLRLQCRQMRRGGADCRADGATCSCANSGSDSSADGDYRGCASSSMDGRPGGGGDSGACNVICNCGVGWTAARAASTPPQR